MTKTLPIHEVVVAGPLVVSRIDALQEQLLNALDSAASIRIDISAATDLDLSFLQLLVAARRSAVAEDKTLTVTASPMLSRQVERCGLDHSALPGFHGATPERQEVLAS